MKNRRKKNKVYVGKWNFSWIEKTRKRCLVSVGENRLALAGKKDVIFRDIN